MEATLQASRLERFTAFIAAVHPPKVYALFAGLWAMSLFAVFSGFDGAWRLTFGQAAVAVSFFLILLFLRAVDEMKDFDYDRRHNPDRPLVSGTISHLEVIGVALAAAGLTVLINLTLSPWLALFTAANMAYGVLLWALERYWRRMRVSVLLNLAITFPVSAALNVYAWSYLSLANTAAPSLGLALPVILAYLCAALHFEFGRKLKWPQHAQAGENGYALALGTRRAVLVCIGLGMFSVGFMSLSFWLMGIGGVTLAAPTLAWLGSAAGLLIFAGSRRRHRDLKPYFGLFLLGFFLVNIIVIVTQRGVTI
ncbi:hypothetical protein CAI21_04100 [Alkalilimnicola ehrlichii]|uniref:UbiA prenyltransferase n=1 Tax=Alkalilimnicola ehrlichii TaxID=351052 RepID=A0A3E0WZ27_9GAMM|nr:UbiA family prenyltransferase [Alkalilimnicola ehrlichii]RFA30701.1 hypothetical protein CAI21_04100 [Alkalilimnicola ehrlichii]RFA38278.1 hypothetical protein CAL65_05465 [Alkalilimnicola ehrlichii]